MNMDVNPEMAQAGPPKVILEFHTSSTGKGGESYKVVVTSDATIEDVNRTLFLAKCAREGAIKTLEGGPL